MIIIKMRNFQIYHIKHQQIYQNPNRIQLIKTLHHIFGN